MVHDQYIDKIARKFGQTTGSTPATPLPNIEFKKHNGEASKKQIKAYQERVGSVLYTAITARPDVAFASSLLSQYATNPGPEHFTAINWLIRYLFGTRFLGIVYGSSKTRTLFIASDASFADDPDTRRSSQGYVIMMFGGAVIWKAVRQATVTTSTTEAEVLSLQTLAKETMWLQRFFRDLLFEIGETWELFCDNQQAIRLVVNQDERLITKLRHVDIQNMWLKQEYARGSFDVTYLPTNEMPADGLTKN